MPLAISTAAERHLDRWADAVQRGELSIWQLPLAVQQFVSIGWADGIAYAQRQAREYEHQLDRMALAILNPRERTAELQQRLDQHFAQLDAEFFAEPTIVGPATRPIHESQFHTAERRAA